MALTRIQRGMIASSAVGPDNIISTASYVVGAVSANTLTVSSSIVVSGGSGLKLQNLRSSTSSYALYYNNSTDEITFGIANQGGGSSFDQSLNTTDSVKFSQITATTTISVGSTLKFSDNTQQTTAWPGTLSYNDLTNKPTSYSTSTITGLSKVGYTNNYNDLDNKPTSYSTSTITGLSKVGYTNNYNDLDNKPTISNLSTVTNQTLMTTSTVTFKTLVITGGNLTGNNAPNGIVGGAGSAGELVLSPGSTGGSIYLQNPGNNGYGVFVQVRGSIYPSTNNSTTNPNYLGGPTNRWKQAWIETVTVGKNTIIFEDYDELTSSTFNTSTLSIQTGTIFVDGLPLVNQAVGLDDSPQFASMTATTSLTIADYTMPTAIASTSGYAMVAGTSGQIEFQPAILTGNVSIDGGFSTSIYTAFDYAIDGGAASA